MLDIKFIRENKELVKEAIKNKNINLNLDELLEADDERRKLQQEIDGLRARRNEIADTIMRAQGKPDVELIKKGKELKEKTALAEKEIKEVDEKFFNLMIKAPTIPSHDTPIGKNDTENVEVYKWGEPTKFDFEPRSYLEIAENLGLLDLEKGAKVGGYRSYYVKNDGVMLQIGFLMYALEKCIKKGFIPEQ
ncbi:MAG: serine--tRNA ligase, partial [bacterium]